MHKHVHLLLWAPIRISRNAIANLIANGSKVALPLLLLRKVDQQVSKSLVLT